MRYLLLILMIALLIPSFAAAQPPGGVAVESIRCSFVDSHSSRRNKLSVPFLVPAYNGGVEIGGAVDVHCTIYDVDAFWTGKFFLQRYNPIRGRWANVDYDIQAITDKDIESLVVFKQCGRIPRAWGSSVKFRLALTLVVGNIEGTNSASFHSPFGLYKCY